MNKIIQLKLKFFAKKIIKKYNPKIIGITGSVGKTSAREAIYTVLSSKYNVRQSIKNYNNEIGVPLTVIGGVAPGKSVFRWLKIFKHALELIIFKDKEYPEILILEMGVDRVGDMEYLNSILKCDIGVVTMIGSSHLEFFGTINKIKKEKELLIKNLKKSGWAILNYDNKETRKMINASKVKVSTYGFEERADIKAQEIKFNFLNEGKTKNSLTDLSGVNFKINYNGSSVPVLLPNAISNNSIYSALSAVSVGIAYEMNLINISKALYNLKALPGRMNLLKGIKNTIIIDDTYNSSPQSCFSVLDVIEKMPLKNNVSKFAVFGDMLELGGNSEEEHIKVGNYLVKSGVDKLIVVGERSRDIARGAKNAGMKNNNIFHFSNTDLAGRFIQERIKKGDLILIKGSQGMRMEKIVKEIMAEPLRSKELLVRQDSQWI